MQAEKSELILLTGLKRTGKTSVLFQYANKFENDVLYLNFEHPGLYEFDRNDFFKLDEIIEQKNVKILLFDCITAIKGWSFYIKQKMDEGFKIVLTTSNTQVLNLEEGAGLTGRYIRRELMPLSFTEYCNFYTEEKNENTTVKYIEDGGYPEKCKQNDEYLSQLFDDIVVREIGINRGVRDLKSLKRLSLYLLRNVGELITANQLKGKLGIKTTTTVVDYLNYLEAGFLMHYVPKFSYSLRKQAINPRKVYIADTGFVSAAIFSVADKLDQLLENLVYLHLKRQNNEVYYFAEEGNTCDFIAFGKDKPQEAIQVCAHLEQDKLEQEVKGLTEAMDYFEFQEGTVVTLNQTDTFIRDNKTIQVIPFHQFAG
ncbi:ATP-binding protein [uncultured Draconibacterium sp.]|uniref:ATP-binding protein n=1 Tax=uncultured Draconibacterium sp. TaxID=1573823 RepID=UPI0025E7F81D|nr:ATP-binding protein [uncultured Draconibacterium sp.]